MVFGLMINILNNIIFEYIILIGYGFFDRTFFINLCAIAGDAAEALQTPLFPVYTDCHNKKAVHQVNHDTHYLRASVSAALACE